MIQDISPYFAKPWCEHGYSFGYFSCTWLLWWSLLLYFIINDFHIITEFSAWSLTICSWMSRCCKNMFNVSFWKWILGNLVWDWPKRAYTLSEHISIFEIANASSHSRIHSNLTSLRSRLHKLHCSYTIASMTFSLQYSLWI